MGIASYLRFIVGLLLSVEIVRQLILGKEISSYVTILAAIFIGLSVWFFVGKIFLGR